MIVSETPNRVHSCTLMACVLLCAMVVLPVGLGAAGEQTRVKKAPESFEEIDSNGDGFIDLKEAKVLADYATSQQAASVKPIIGEQILASMDTNRDGKISKDELVAMAAFQTKSQQAGTAERKAAEKIVRSMDANRDGKISKDEISAVMKPYFEQIDTNGDGFIDAKEAWGMAYYANSQQVQGRVTAEQIVGHVDRNGDGKISRDEAAANLKPYFEQYDANKDGVIDVKEAQVLADYATSQQVQRPATAEQIVGYLDRNGDGKISKDEASAELKPYFEQYDANKDGVIDVTEAQVMADYVNSQQVQGRVTAEQIVSYMDKNGDGKISKDEASEELKPHFEQIDANKDGVIDVKEAQVMADYQNNQQAGSTKLAPAGEPVTAKQIISFMDKNRDGRITKNEASEDLKLFFAQYDANKDGAIDVKEAQALVKYANREQAGSSEPAPAPGRVTAKQIISYMDKNGDGKLGKDEASKEVKANFQFIDTNGDGVIDVKEAQVMADYANKAQDE